MKYKPYMSPSDYPSVLYRLKQLGDGGRAPEEESIQGLPSVVQSTQGTATSSKPTPQSHPHAWAAVASQSVEMVEARRRSTIIRKKRWGADAEAQDGQAVSATDKAKAFVTNYNTMEAALLFSAVLVCLSGIMLQVSPFVCSAAPLRCLLTPLAPLSTEHSRRKRVLCRSARLHHMDGDCHHRGVGHVLPDYARY